MNRYILDPEDAIHVLPPQAGESAQIEIVCGRTMIFFDIAALESVCTAHGLCGGDAVRFVGADALLGAKHEVYVPSSRPERAPLCEALKNTRRRRFLRRRWTTSARPATTRARTAYKNALRFTNWKREASI